MYGGAAAPERTWVGPYVRRYKLTSAWPRGGCRPPALLTPLCPAPAGRNGVGCRGWVWGVGVAAAPLGPRVRQLLPSTVRAGFNGTRGGDFPVVLGPGNTVVYIEGLPPMPPTPNRWSLPHMTWLRWGSMFKAPGVRFECPGNAFYESRGGAPILKPRGRCPRPREGRL